MGVINLGQINGLPIYYDEEQSQDLIHICRMDRERKFLLGGTLDMKLYKKALRDDDPVYDRDMKIEEDLGII